ncbi:MAG: hypothetical protein QXI52_05485 [Nitrososphaerota archaeon]
MKEIRYRCIMCMEERVAVNYLEIGDKVLLLCPRGHRQFLPKKMLRIH